MRELKNVVYEAPAVSVILCAVESALAVSGGYVEPGLPGSEDED